ncbi:MAG: amidohydrolase family protein [Planctomycetota bacterium]|jgi:imidazolonepropionase-like amidohydrolase|nr:amidohydrolase family protein [Planctomycetota bacterium]MDP6940782.1 amidohydrolase family protein [Planctomycetota bacterium]
MILLSALTLALLPQQEPVQAVRAAKVFTSSEAGVVNNGIVVWQGNRLLYVGREENTDLPEDLVIQDLGDLWLAPGLVEPHCHVAGSLRDLNDTVYLTNPEINSLSVVEPNNPMVKDGLAGGVTSALLIPGSGSNMGGWGTLVKFSGKTINDVVVRSPGSLKIAQAGNPERWGYRVGRMMMNWNTRHTLERGLNWARNWKAGNSEWDPMLAPFLGLLEKTIPPSVHTQIYQVVLMTITMQVRDLGLASFIDHGTFDGYKAGPMAVEHDVPVMNGPRQFWYDRSRARFQGNGAGWSEYVPQGLVLGYNTDSPVIPQEELSYQAAMGVRLGHDDPSAALQGITSNAAFALKVDNRLGSLQSGLEADFVAWTGFPLDPRSSVVRAWVNGELAYESKEARRF